MRTMSIQEEGGALGNVINAWLQTVFYVAMFLVLFSTNIGVADYVGRLAEDSLKVTFLKSSSFWSAKRAICTKVLLGTDVDKTTLSEPASDGLLPRCPRTCAGNVPCLCRR
jgi:hypothetical protein